MAVWSVVTMAPLAVNVAVLAPLATVTDGGTVRAVLLLDNKMVTPAPDAGWLNATVQMELPGTLILVGLQRRLVKAVPAGPTAIVPAVPVITTAPPAIEAPNRFVTPIEIDPVAVGESVTLMSAIVPF
jgi:hypothetical protein